MVKKLSLLFLTVLLLASSVSCGNDSSQNLLTPAAIPTLPATHTPVPSTPFPNYRPSLFGATDANAPLISGGSTRLEPLYDKWLSGFAKVAPNVKITYQATGSGSGQAAFLGTPVPQGTYPFKPTSPLDFAGTDITYNSQQLLAASTKGQVVHIPVILGALVVCYRYDNVQMELRLSPQTVAKIFLGQIRDWSHPDIKIDSGTAFPAKPLTVVIRRRNSSGSGTSEIFSRYLALFNDQMRDKVGVSSEINWPEFGQIEADSNIAVADIISQRDGSIGYVGQEVATARNLKYASLRNQKGRYIKATPDAIIAAAQSSTIADDFRTFIIDAPGVAAYPIVAFTWLLVWKDFKNMPDPSPTKAQALANFLWWALHEGQQRENLPADFAPLPTNVVQRLETLFVNTDATRVLQYEQKPILNNLAK